MGASRDFDEGNSEYLSYNPTPGNKLTSYPFSYCFWFKLNSIVGGEYDWMFCIQDYNNSSFSPCYGIRYIGGTGLQIVAINPDFRPATGSSLNTGQWYHITGIHAGNTDHRLYLDGVLDATQSTSQTASANVDLVNLMCIQDNTNTFNYFADGNMADVHIFDRELTVPEINELMWRPRSIVDDLVLSVDMVNSGVASTDIIDLSQFKEAVDNSTMPAEDSSGPAVFMFGGQ